MEPTGISKIWLFFKQSFIDRPNEDKGAGLSAFKAEWDAMEEKDRAHIRAGIENGTLTY
jgi:hypothetical protein